MLSKIGKNAIEVVKKFNKENRFRDTGIINNSIDLLLALVNKQYKENQVLKLKLKQLKRTRDLLDVDTNRETINELVQAVKQLNKEIKELKERM